MKERKKHEEEEEILRFSQSTTTYGVVIHGLK